ncbi:hypothetical protein BKA67DRAFT_653829 [Truncatella angustata]|uniref:Uncharacterized protein n=1 Tax=Truncatella angustata TaxID=152316 RepID=A0A9P8UZ57_9PEZI|nr:uncharacterized protein BKA67DRAFT_653829 [Truncatella angustata]KAH6660666.1 hypothetical protein BKA67DRAFT_653829 [Truncatella angustata]KAH8199294.1 hypothetical protein TruAng_006530 [Truncatella angustata]
MDNSSSDQATRQATPPKPLRKDQAGLWRFDGSLEEHDVASSSVTKVRRLIEVENEYVGNLREVDLESFNASRDRRDGKTHAGNIEYSQGSPTSVYDYFSDTAVLYMVFTTPAATSEGSVYPKYIYNVHDVPNEYSEVAMEGTIKHITEHVARDALDTARERDLYIHGIHNIMTEWMTTDGPSSQGND